MPEHNLIQAPEILARLTRELGVKQAHIVPSLNEGVQPVVLLHDLTKASPSRQRIVYGHAVGLGTVGTAPSVVLFCPPINASQIRVRVVAVTVYSAVAISYKAQVSISASANLNNLVGGTQRFGDYLPGTPEVPYVAQPFASVLAGDIAIPATCDFEADAYAYSTWKPEGLFLTHGRQLQVTSSLNGVNAMSVSIEWEEIQPEPATRR